MTTLLQDTSTSASSAILLTLVDSSTSDPGFPTSSDERTSQSNTKRDVNTQPNNTGAIVGGVIGSIALLCASGIANSLATETKPQQIRYSKFQAAYQFYP